MLEKPAGYFTIPEFIDYFPMSRSTFYRLVAKGELVIVKCGRSSRLSKADVAAWEARLVRTGSNDNG